MTKEIILEELLDKNQLKQLKALTKQLEKEKINPMDTRYVARIKALLRPWSMDLLKKGYVPDYLAYVIVAMGDMKC